MIINQAIYTSANVDSRRGYHLVSRSKGVSEKIAQALCRWSPSHGCLSSEETRAESLNFFQPLPDCYAISRTIYGGPEFSQRGGRQSVTISLLFRRNQLTEFECNAVTCTRIALTSGWLALPLQFSRTLPEIEFPNTALNRTSGKIESSELLYLLQTGKQIAFLGTHDPLSFLDRILQSMPMSERLNISFATGLKRSAQRPFRIQFFQNADSKLKNELIHNGMSVRELR